MLNRCDRSTNHPSFLNPIRPVGFGKTTPVSCKKTSSPEDQETDQSKEVRREFKEISKRTEAEGEGTRDGVRNRVQMVRVDPEEGYQNNRTTVQKV